MVKNDMPNEARSAPAVSARSTKNDPKLCVARSIVPSAGFNRYWNPLDDEASGTEVRFTSSAREMASRAASAAARSRSKSPVWTS